MEHFRERFDAQLGLRLYHQAKGYVHQGDYQVWEPQNLAEIEETANYGPGAMARGELDDYDCSDCEEF